MEASHPEPGTLHAWIEGELDRFEHERIEAHLAECARCREAVAEARGLIAGASRIVSTLDGAPAGVVPRRHRFGARRPRFVPARWAAAAAVLLFAATSVVVSREFKSTDIRPPDAASEATRSSERLAIPAASPTAGPAQPPPGVANVAAARRSAATSTREPSRTVSGERASALEVRDGARSEREQTRQVSARAEDVATADRVATESDLTGQVVARQAAGQIAPTAAAPPAPQPPVTPAPAEPRPSLERSQRNPALRLDEAPIAGAAASPTGARNARVVRVVRYEARPGVIVTLTEYEEPQPDRPAIRIRGQARAQVSAARPEYEQLSAAPSSSENVYMWQHPERGRFYVLRGPLPRAELESLARRLSEFKVVR